MRSTKSERWTDDTMTNEEQYIREMDRQYNDKRGAVNRREGCIVCPSL
jgi:hypothetical protein